MDALTDTIAAIATSQGRAGIGVIRLSGPQVVAIANQILGSLPPPRQAVYQSFSSSSKEVIDKGIALYFPAPHSFTGEDVLELQGHGGPVILGFLLSTVLQYGARLAEPGEFTQRAFLNGKIDLAQAEAVADLIDATTIQAALSASRSLQGWFSRQIETLAKDIMHLRVYVEAAIDFPEEEVDFLSDGKILEDLQNILAKIHALQKEAKQGQLLKEGLTVAIVGQPNAGKSSLLNCLTQNDTAIVTPIPGTTRDLIKESIQIDGFPVHIIDTAGIRKEAGFIEQEGIKRAELQQQLADRILLVVDATANPQISEVESSILQQYGPKVTLVMNKVDLLDIEEGEREGKIYLSAKSGQGIEILRRHLKNCLGLQTEEMGSFTARGRHLEALQKTYEHCLLAKMQLVDCRAGELVAQELRNAQERLGAIVGKVSTEDVLGNIFANFCIGK